MDGKAGRKSRCGISYKPNTDHRDLQTSRSQPHFPVSSSLITTVPRRQLQNSYHSHRLRLLNSIPKDQSARRELDIRQALYKTEEFPRRTPARSQDDGQDGEVSHGDPAGRRSSPCLAAFICVDNLPLIRTTSGLYHSLGHHG